MNKNGTANHFEAQEREVTPRYTTSPAIDRGQEGPGPQSKLQIDIPDFVRKMDRLLGSKTADKRTRMKAEGWKTETILEKTMADFEKIRLTDKHRLLIMIYTHGVLEGRGLAQLGNLRINQQVRHWKEQEMGH